MNHPIQQLSEFLSSRQPAVLVTVTATSGASPARPGAQMVVAEDGKTFGTVGGGKLEAAILVDAKAAFTTHRPGVFHYALTEEGTDSIGTLCGGEVTVFVQPYFPTPRLIIAGGGHIGRPLKTMGEAAGFEVSVVDVVPGRATLPELEQASLNQHSYVVLITTDHVSDEAALRLALKSPAPYIGMIGSLAKCRAILDHLRSDGYSESEFHRVYAPIGLDLGCTAPEEIAVAILAEIVAVKCRQSIPEKGIPLRRLT